VACNQLSFRPLTFSLPRSDLPFEKILLSTATKRFAIISYGGIRELCSLFFSPRRTPLTELPPNPSLTFSSLHPSSNRFTLALSCSKSTDTDNIVHSEGVPGYEGIEEIWGPKPADIEMLELLRSMRARDQDTEDVKQGNGEPFPPGDREFKRSFQTLLPSPPTF